MTQLWTERTSFRLLCSLTTRATTPPSLPPRLNCCFVKNHGCHLFQIRTSSACTMENLPLQSDINSNKKYVFSLKTLPMTKGSKLKTILTKMPCHTISTLTTWCGTKTLHRWVKMPSLPQNGKAWLKSQKFMTLILECFYLMGKLKF